MSSAAVLVLVLEAAFGHSSRHSVSQSVSSEESGMMVARCLLFFTHRLLPLRVLQPAAANYTYLLLRTTTTTTTTWRTGQAVQTTLWTVQTQLTLPFSSPQLLLHLLPTAIAPMIPVLLTNCWRIDFAGSRRYWTVGKEKEEEEEAGISVVWAWENGRSAIHSSTTLHKTDYQCALWMQLWGRAPPMTAGNPSFLLFDQHSHLTAFDRSR